MKTQKIVVHGIDIPIAMQAIKDGIVDIPRYRTEYQRTKVRLFGPTGAPIVEYQAASFTTCICAECKLRREKEASILKFRAWKTRQPVARLFKPSGKKARIA